MAAYAVNCKLNSLVCFLLFLLDSRYPFTEARGPQHVTCGSVVKLLNSAYKVRLHSHDVKYGSGSGQQSVTGTELKEDVNSHWAIKGIDSKPCQRGNPVACGNTIRLEHISTLKNLHSHLFSSPLSGSQEISAFGENGDGDTGDYWTVICDGDYWERDENIMFRHVDTERYLASSGHTFGRPINGQMEIIGIQTPDHTSRWQAVEGMYIHPTNFNPKHAYMHTEL